METKTRYTVVNKIGQEIYHANSFLGFIGTTILVQIVALILFVIFAMVVCGIGSIFS